MTRLALIALLVAGCGGEDTSATPDAAMPTADAAPANKVIAVTCPATPAATVMTMNGATTYMPPQTTIGVNDIVKFVMSTEHDVEPNPLTTTDPGIMVNFGETKCLQFTQAGTYGFYCGPHGFVGTITVN